MLVRFAIRRITRHWQLLLVPLLGVCLATGLFALAPLYSRAVTEMGLRYTLATEKHQRVNIRVIDEQPLDESVFKQAANILGDLFQAKYDVASSTRLNEYNMQARPRQFRKEGWFFYSYSELEEHTTLVAGRWPRDKLPYFVPSVGGWRVDAGLEPAGRLVLRRATADLEAVATEASLAQMGIHFPQQVRRIHLGPGQLDPIIQIVGVIKANDRDQAYWMAQSQPLDGIVVAGPDGEPLFFGSLFVTRPAMERVVDGIQDQPTLKDDLKIQPGSSASNQSFLKWYGQLKRRPVSSLVADQIYAQAQRLGFLTGIPRISVTYSWHVILNRDFVTAGTMHNAAGRVLRMGETVTAPMPESQVITSLVSILRVFVDNLREVQAPITFLTAGVLVLVLYYVLTTTSLALEQQANEWATVSSRGGSAFQLIFIHGIVVLFQCLIGFGLGLPVAQGLLFLLRRAGPLAQLAVGPTLHIAAPPETWNYAAIAALFSAVALLLPSIPAARRTIVTLQQAIARPPHRPAWSRFFLDLLLLALGATLLWRAGRLGNLQTETFTGQTTLDAMSVLAPLLILTGGALFWLRLYPWFMRLIGMLAARVRGLAVPLAFWGISRNPGHYAQLVLLLLSAFGLGAMAATLDATRDAAAWQKAQFDAGGAVRVVLKEKVDYAATAWDQLPGVTATSPVFHGYTGAKDRANTLQLIGIEPETLAAIIPLEPDLLQPLTVGESANLGGIPLPENVANLSLWAHHAAVGADAELTVRVAIADRWGHPLFLEMQGDPLTQETWVQWQASMPPAGGRAPWRLIAITLTSQRGTAGIVTGRVTIDNLKATLPDGSSVIIESFEQETANWSPPQDGDPLDPTQVQASVELAHSGARALALDYRVIETNRYSAPPNGAWVNRVDTNSNLIPVLIEKSWAEHQRLKVGDPLRVDIILGPPFDIRGQRIYCQVAGIMETFPTLGDSPRPFVIGPLHTLLPAINFGAQDWPLEPNEIWMNSDALASPAELLAQLAQPNSGVLAVHTAFNQREILRREPLANAFAGILFGGFWVALVLSLVGLGFYLMLTARRRMVSFSVLRALGWSGRDVWRLLVIEQLSLALPAVVVGIALGVQLAALVRRFIPLVAGTTLVVPPGELAVMVIGLGIGLALLLLGTGLWLQKRQLARTLRLGGE